MESRESGCDRCGRRPAILVVPEKIYWDVRGNAIKSDGRLSLCAACFWSWSHANIPEVREEAVVQI